MSSTKGLKSAGLGLWGSFAIGLSSTAPAYSLAATLGLMVAAVGAQAPAALVLAFIPMLFTAVAYNELNKEDPDCGTTFTWASKAFGSRTGWMGGWALALSGVVVLANLAAIAGEYLWKLISPDLTESPVLVTATGVGFIALMTWLNIRGITLGDRMQKILLVIQYAALALFVIMAAVRIRTGSAYDFTPVDVEWFNPLAAGSLTAMTYAVLLALFIYWGWDTCLALNEETRNPGKTPGRAALLSSAALLVTYVGVSVLVMVYAGIGEDGLGLGNEAHADDVLYAVSEDVMGPWAWIIIVAVLVSAVSSTQTTILPTARGTLAMAVHGALPARFGAVHPKHQTPVFATVLMGAVSSAYYFGMSLLSENFLEDSIASLGLFIAFYYGLTAYACVWHFRATLTASLRNFVMRGLLPLAGAVSMTAALIISAADMIRPGYGSTVMGGVGGAFVIGAGSMLLGGVLMCLWYRSPAAAARQAVEPSPQVREIPSDQGEYL